jgi:hypothetical protein
MKLVIKITSETLIVVTEEIPCHVKFDVCSCAHKTPHS